MAVAKAIARLLVTFIDELSKKAVFLELRQKYVAMGRALRCHLDFYLFDAQKLV